MMIPFLEKYYRMAPNGKQELWGRDGAEHLVISAFVMVVVPIAVVLFTIAGFHLLNTSTEYLSFSHLAVISSGMAWIVMRVVWFAIEFIQEKNMIDKHNHDPENLWKFWKWSDARKKDMLFPFVGDTIILILFYIL